MIEQIIQSLNKNSIEHYLINETTEHSTELFFIKKNLDMRRSKDVTKYEVTIYSDFVKNDVKMRGFATCSIYPGMSDEELSKKLSDAKYSCQFACNPYFEFPEPNKEICENDNIYSQEDVIANMTTALFANDTASDCFINSAEIFVKNNKYHTVSSWGTDVSYERQNIEGEFVVQCTSPEDVETYQDFYYTTPDTDALSEKVRRTIDLTRQRAIATRCNINGSIKLIISGQYVADLLDFYTTRASASMIYPKYSDFEEGKQVQSSNITADALNITLTSELPFSSEGIKMTDRTLLENGVLKTIHGPARFCHYLNITPTGPYKGIRVNSGSTPLSDMETGKYLHVVNFSDFQMDAMSGRFGGEFRLAFYSDGEKVIPLTGGSISGSIMELAGNMKLSSEMQTLKDYTGPFAISIDNVIVG